MLKLKFNVPADALASAKIIIKTIVPHVKPEILPKATMLHYEHDVFLRLFPLVSFAFSW